MSSERYDIPEQQYHAETGLGEGLYLTRSMICDYLESPRGFYLRHVKRIPQAVKEWTPSLSLGSVVDAMLSGETHKVIQAPAEHLTPSGAMSTKKATKDWLSEQDKLGVTVCDDATYSMAQLLCSEAERHPICKHLIKRTTSNQVTLRWTDPKTGLSVQTRPDRLAAGLCWGDDKTTRKPLHQFMSSVAEYGYDIQQVMAMDGAAACGMPPLPFCFLVMQTTFPFDVGVIKLQQRVVDSAYARFHQALEGIKNEQYGSADEDLRTAHVPFWWTERYETETGA